MGSGKRTSSSRVDDPSRGEVISARCKILQERNVSSFTPSRSEKKEKEEEEKRQHTVP